MDFDNDVRTTKRNGSAFGRSVETPVLFFAVCGPKFAKLSTHVQERLQFSSQSRFPFNGFERQQQIITVSAAQLTRCHKVRRIHAAVEFW